MYTQIQDEVKDYLNEANQRLLKQLRKSLKTQTDAYSFILVLLDEYDSLCQAARLISTILYDLVSVVAVLVPVVVACSILSWKFSLWTSRNKSTWRGSISHGNLIIRICFVRLSMKTSWYKYQYRICSIYSCMYALSPRVCQLVACIHMTWDMYLRTWIPFGLVRVDKTMA